jgi:hypothetical protein
LPTSLLPTKYRIAPRLPANIYKLILSFWALFEPDRKVRNQIITHRLLGRVERFASVLVDAPAPELADPRIGREHSPTAGVASPADAG